MGVYYMYQSVVVAQISSMIGSTAITWSSPMLPKLNVTVENPLGRIITLNENSWLTTIATLGACFGSISYGAILPKYGRRTLIISLQLIFFIFYLILASTHSIWMFYVSRFFTGFGTGAVITIIPIYMGEIAAAESRCLFGCTLVMFINIGMLMPYCIGPYVSFFWFHVILAIIPALLVLLSIFCVPESPYFLIRENHAEAEYISTKLWGKSEAMETFKWIEQEMDKSSKSFSVKIFITKSSRRALFIGVGTAMFSNLTGNGVILAYAESMFNSVGFNFVKGLGPILIGFSQLLTAVVMSVIADKFSRKSLLYFSHSSICLVQIILGSHFYLMTRYGDYSSIVVWLPPVCLFLIATLYNVGIGPVFSTMLGELFPTEVKGISVSCIVMFNWICTSALNFSFNTWVENLGMSSLFWAFSAFGVLAILFVHFCVVETRGKTLQEIQDTLSL